MGAIELAQCRRPVKAKRHWRKGRIDPPAGTPTLRAMPMTIEQIAAEALTLPSEEQAISPIRTIF